jgi:protease-4
MKDRLIGCLTAFLILGLIGSLGLNFLLFLALASSGAEAGLVSSVQRPAPLTEEFVSGDKDAENKILLIDLAGIITSADEGLEGSMADQLIRQIRQGRDDGKVKAILLRINSPGGEVVASDVLYHEIKKARAAKPVVVYMETVAASGGYYAALGGSYLMAGDLTITGSIGVILQTLNLKDLADKVGIRAVTFKSGANKDLLNSFREMTPEEQQIVQTLINETYGKFLGIVATERKLNAEELRATVADGRILSGEQALASKLIDGLGYLDDAIAKSKELASVKSAQVVRYEPALDFSRLFRLFGRTEAKIDVQVMPVPLRLEPGKLYYLSTHLFGSF